MAYPNRTYPLKQPANWKPPVPRWQLVLPRDTASIQTLYVGVQCHDSSTSPVFQDAISGIENWLASLQNHQVIGPSVVDIFVVETGHDLPYTRVWTCYWTQQSSFDHAIALLDLSQLHQSLGNGRSSIGLWTESFITSVSRLESNYAGLHEFPGLSRLPDTKREEHKLTAFWGAARDCLPDSANDLFEMLGTSQDLNAV